MKHFFYLSVLSVLILTSCTSGYKKGDNGIEYKIISSGNGNTLVNGDYMQMHITQMYKDKNKDTLLGDTREVMPRVEMFDSSNTPPSYYKILKQVRKGDSLVLRLLTDSAFKDAPTQMAPFMHKGGYVYTTVKIINIFKTREEADSANKAEMKLGRPKIYKKEVEEAEKKLADSKQQIETDSKIIEDYLAKNNIKAIKGKWGTYIAIHSEGGGDKITNENVVTVNYTGRTLDSGKVFDSNLDPQFQHVEPLQVTMSQVGSVILGWTDALMQLKKGDKATIYIPSALAYGKNGNPPKINPDANLVFDIDIVDVITEDEMMARSQAIQQKIMEAQKLKEDSLQKASGSKK
jgi:FKBP-type peptidyl-prolyl cis-trans isomerase FkpA